MKSILIVDDDRYVLSSLNRLLRSGNYDLTLTQDPFHAIELCRNNSYGLIISDQKMPALSGTQLFSELEDLQPNATKIILSGYSDFNEITAAFNQQLIHQFISKPWDDNALLEIVRSTVLTGAVSEEFSTDSIFDVASGLSDFHGILSANKSFLKLFDKIRRAANSNASVYLYGETGVGKELFSRALHEESERVGGPFVAVNCANFNEQLMESQLFGHIKGAFTGADSHQQGLLVSANGGTLFLDEVSTLPLVLQAKLLRVLQEKEYSPVGSTEKYPFDACVISASNKHLSIAVSDNEFREDLYYRLCVIPLLIPPLRDRGDDALMLFEHFLNKLSPKKYFEKSDLKPVIQSYGWPGNIRQLANVCQYIAAMSENDEVTVADLPEDVTQVSLPYEDKEIIELTEEVIKQALEKYSNNKTAAAKELGVSRMTLWRRIKQFDSNTL